MHCRRTPSLLQNPHPRLLISLETFAYLTRVAHSAATQPVAIQHIPVFFTDIFYTQARTHVKFCTKVLDIHVAWYFAGLPFLSTQYRFRIKLLARRFRSTALACPSQLPCARCDKHYLPGMNLHKYIFRHACVYT